MNLADNLKKIRKKHNLSQEQLAEKLGVSRQSVSKWESGLAYPEMDKMLQLCQMFSLNIDDLLNQDLNQINGKQSKNNINKFIDDFLGYITKTVDMFSAMKFKEKIKCLIEQLIIIFIITIILLVIGLISSTIFSNLISFLPQRIYYLFYHLFEGIYFLVCLILGIILVLHIFKIRYLDYYIIIKDESSNIDDVIKKNDDETVYISDNKKTLFTSKQDKIIIRDPENSCYKFISSLIRCLLFFIKTIVSIMSMLLCIPLVLLTICIVISFLFIKTGTLFVGVLLCILSLISINLIVLVVLYNFTVSKKTQETKAFIIFIISLFTFGIGMGVVSLGITKFDIIDDINTKYFVSEEQILEMTDDLFFETYNGEIEYIESENSDIKLIYKYSDIYKIDIKEHNNGYFIHLNFSKSNSMSAIRKTIEDINNKLIINYSNCKFYIYTTKENIEILKNNLNEHYKK